MFRFLPYAPITVVFLCFACISGGFVYADDREKPGGKTEGSVTKEDLEDIFQKWLTQRERIKSGQMEIINEIENYREGSLHGKVRRDIKIAFDENRRRVDRRNEYLNKFVSNDVGCIGCYQKNNRLVLGYSNQFANRKPNEDPTESTMCVIYDDKQLKENLLTKFWTDDYGFVPQYIACFYLSRIPTAKYAEKSKELFWNNTVGMLGYADVTVNNEEYKGILCKKITFESKWEEQGAIGLTTLWFSEEQGYSMRKFCQEIKGGSTSLKELLEVDVVQDKASGIWFPSSWHYEQEREGKLRTRQNGTIKNVVLNQPIPDDIFDMKKIDILPKGVHVLWQATEVPPPHEGKLIWDGNDIVSGETHGAHLIDIPPKGSRIRKLLLINGAILCFIFAAVSYRSYRRQQRLSLNTPA